MYQQQPEHHILPLHIYLRVGALLLILTVVTVIVAQFNFGPYNLVVAMFIASVKATAVVLYFMHLKYDSRLYASVFLASFIFLAIFIVFILFDTLRRGDLYTERARATIEQVEFGPVKESPTTDTTENTESKDTPVPASQHGE